MRWATGLLTLLLSGPLAAQSIAFISDLNGRYGSTDYHPRVTAAVAAITELRPDLVISTGDMVAGQKSRLENGQFTQMWQALNRVVADPLLRARIPLAVAVGNHDGSAYPGFARDREMFELQWRARSPLTPKAAPSPTRAQCRLHRLQLAGPTCPHQGGRPAESHR